MRQQKTTETREQYLTSACRYCARLKDIKGKNNDDLSNNSIYRRR